MEDLPFLEVFSTTSRGGDQSSNRYNTYRRANGNALGNLRELAGLKIGRIACMARPGENTSDMKTSGIA
jgi:hypothetical protein